MLHIFQTMVLLLSRKLSYELASSMLSVGNMGDLTNKVDASIHRHDELDFVSKLLQPAVRPLIEELIKKGTTRGPFIIEFDPTTACNFSCPECISMGLLNKGQINPDRVIEILNE